MRKRGQAGAIIGIIVLLLAILIIGSRIIVTQQPSPSVTPTQQPTVEPSTLPVVTEFPSVRPTITPTATPTVRPTVRPTSTPHPSLTPSPSPQCKQEGKSCGYTSVGAPIDLGFCCGGLVCEPIAPGNTVGTCELPEPSPSPTVTPSPTITPSPSGTPTVSPSPSASPTPTVTPTVTPSPTPTVTPTPIVTPKPTITPTPTVTPSPSPPAENTENNFAVMWFSNAMTKVLRTTAEYPAQKTNTAKISAARNEYESFQLVISSKTSGSKSFTVETWDFQGPAAISKSNIQLYEVDYVDVREYITYSGGVPTLSGTGDPQRLMPDPLVPISVGDSVSLPAGYNQPIWLIVYLPKTAPAGTYTGTISVRFNTGEVLTKKISLEVYGFTLSDAPSLRSLFGLMNVNYHFASTPSTDAYNAMVRKYYAEFKKNRLSPFLYDGALSPMKASDGGLANIRFDGGTTAASINYAFFETAMSNLAQFNTFIFAGMPKNKIYFPKVGTSEEEASLKFFFTNVRSYLIGRGLWSKAVYYLWDEPKASDISNITKYAEWIKTQSVAPDLPLGIAIRSPSGWSGIMCPGASEYTTVTKDAYAQFIAINNQKTLIDIWIPQINTINSDTTQQFAQRIAAGEQLWLYDTSSLVAITRHHQPAWYSLEGKEGVAQRILPWWAAKVGATGLAYYYVNHYSCNNNPWTNPARICGGSGLPAGNGVFFYPPCKESANGKCSGLRDDTRIIISERWELLREGIEDYEYFKMVQSGSALNNAMALLQNDCWYTYDTNPQDYYNARDAVAKAITMTRGPAPQQEEPSWSPWLLILAAVVAAALITFVKLKAARRTTRKHR